MTEFHPKFKEYRDLGRKANLGSVPRESCPYRYGKERDHWLAGWDEGRAAQNKPSTFS